jgi:hypothetical protein
MEIFGARTAKPIQTCIEEVKKSTIFIGFLGMRYGSIDSESGKSFVQIEYETAINEKIETLMYIIDEEKSLVPPKYVDKYENAKKLQDFKEHLRRTHTVETFTTSDDLVKKIDRDIVQLIREKGIVIDEGKFEPLSDNKTTIELIEKFDLMPKRLSGTEIELIVEFTDSPYAIHKQTCDALKLTYGASIARRIKIIEPKDIPYNAFQFLWELFAEDDLCDFLNTAETSKPYKIIAKVSFGIEHEISQKSPPDSLFSLTLCRAPPIIDLQTGEKIESYIRYNPVKALILVKPL